MPLYQQNLQQKKSSILRQSEHAVQIDYELYRPIL